MRFVFCLYPALPTDDPHRFEVPVIVRYARTLETAYWLAVPEIPEGSRIWCWYEDRHGSCTICGGPFHPATGDWESEEKHWCGACARDMYAFLKTMTPRRWGGIRFYDHAFPPPAIDTSEADLRGT